MTIKIYTAEHCGPCHLVRELLDKQGNNVDGEDVRLVDVESDDGFQEFKAQILSKGDAAVPSAYKDGEKCQIRIEDETLHLICGEDGQLSHLPELSDQFEEPGPDTA